MIRTLLLGVVAGVLLFVCNAISWMALPYHTESLNAFPGSPAVVEEFLATLPATGVYHYPGHSDDMEAVVAKMKDGPVVTSMVFRKEGVDAMSPMKFLWSFLLNAASGIVAAMMLRQAHPTFRGLLGRAFFVAGLGVFATAAVIGPEWLWWSHPTDFATLAALDILVPWTLIGLFLGATVRASKQ